LQGTPNLLKLCQQLVPGIHIFVQASSCRVQGAATIHQEEKVKDTPQMANLKIMRKALKFDGFEKACSLPRLPFRGVCRMPP